MKSLFQRWLSNRDMTSDEVERLRSAYQEYVNTHDRQHETQLHLNSRAIEIAKINLLVGSVAASIITFSPETISVLYFLVGSVTLLASIWHCARVYSPTTYDIGVKADAIEDMKSTNNLEDHFEKLADEYSGMVSDFSQPYSEESDDFERGLWLAVATLFLYISGAVATLLTSVANVSYSISLDFVVILIIGVLLMYGKEKGEISEGKAD